MSQDQLEVWTVAASRPQHTRIYKIIGIADSGFARLTTCSEAGKLDAGDYGQVFNFPVLFGKFEFSRHHPRSSVMEGGGGGDDDDDLWEKRKIHFRRACRLSTSGVVGIRSVGCEG